MRVQTADDLSLEVRDEGEGWPVVLLHEWTRGNGDVERYIEDLARPGALIAALKWTAQMSRCAPPVST